MRNELHHDPDFLFALFDSIPSLLFVVDEDVRITHLNAAAKRFNGLDSLHRILDSGGQALNCINVAHDTDACGRTEHCQACLVRRSVGTAARGGTIFRETNRMELLDGSGQRTVHFLMTAAPFIYAGRSLVLLILEDVSELKAAEERLRVMNEQLERQASTDHLTGIFNRLRFNDILMRQIEEAGRYEHPVALAMFDIDHFKQVNDDFGHSAGDNVLREVTTLISKNIRKIDIFARWGGEEFVILSSHTDRDHMQQIAEKLRSSVAAHWFPVPRQITCSFGVTQLSAGDTIESLIGRADEALYQAKHAGRNAVKFR